MYTCKNEKLKTEYIENWISVWGEMEDNERFLGLKMDT